MLYNNAKFLQPSLFLNVWPVLHIYDFITCFQASDRKYNMRLVEKNHARQHKYGGKTHLICIIICYMLYYIIIICIFTFIIGGSNSDCSSCISSRCISRVAPFRFSTNWSTVILSQVSFSQTVVEAVALICHCHLVAIKEIFCRSK